MRSSDRRRTITRIDEQRIAVSNQRSNSVSCLRLANGTWTERGRIALDDDRASTAPAAKEDGAAATTRSARSIGVPGDVLALDTSRLAVVNRGPDEVVPLDVTPACELSVRNRFSSGARRPRALAVAGDQLFASHELGTPHSIPKRGGGRSSLRQGARVEHCRMRRARAFGPWGRNPVPPHECARPWWELRK